METSKISETSVNSYYSSSPVTSVGGHIFGGGYDSEDFEFGGAISDGDFEEVTGGGFDYDELEEYKSNADGGGFHGDVGMLDYTSLDTDVDKIHEKNPDKKNRETVDIVSEDPLILETTKDSKDEKDTQEGETQDTSDIDSPLIENDKATTETATESEPPFIEDATSYNEEVSEDDEKSSIIEDTEGVKGTETDDDESEKSPLMVDTEIEYEITTEPKEEQEEEQEEKEQLGGSNNINVDETIVGSLNQFLESSNLF